MNTHINVTVECTVCEIKQQILDEPADMFAVRKEGQMCGGLILAFMEKHKNCAAPSPCPRCLHPHRVKNPYYEWHTLTCKACGHEERV